MSDRRYTAAAVQFEPTLFAKEQNVAALVGLVEAAADNGARLVTTPEMGTTGYCLFDHDEAATVVEPIPGPTTERFSAVAAARGCHIVVGMPEIDETSGLFYNTAVLIGPDGVVGRHRKSHPYIAEPKWAAPGDLGHQVFDTELGRIALLICMDIHFVETARIVALAGAEVICHVSNWLAERTPAPYWISRALENSCYVVESNRWGLERSVQFSGGSCVIRPDGTVASSVDTGDGIAYAEIDRDAVGRDRDGGPGPIHRRRPELYRELQANTFLWNPGDFFGLYGHRPLPRGRRGTVAVAQTEPTGSVSENLLRHREVYRDAVTRDGAELVVFPELALTGPVATTSELADRAQTLDGPRLAELMALTAEHGAHLVTGIVEHDPDHGGYYNTVVVLGPEGVVGTYRKIHLAPGEHGLFRPGERWVTVDLPIGRVGLCTGDDALLPESCRILALRGADLVVCPAALDGGLVSGHPGTRVPLDYPIPTGRTSVHWHHLRVRAGENNTYLAFANAVNGERRTGGRSGIFGPDTFAFPRTERVLSTDTGLAALQIDTTSASDEYPTSPVRRKDLVLMRLPHHYATLSSADEPAAAPTP